MSCIFVSSIIAKFKNFICQFDFFEEMITIYGKTIGSSYTKWKFPLSLCSRLEPCAAHRSISSVGSSCTSDSSSSSLSSGGAGEMPLVFSNALHLAVEYGSVDVLRLLLKYGLEPNQGGRVAGGLGDHPATRPPIQPSTPTTTTSPTHTSITGNIYIILFIMACSLTSSL